MLLPFIVGIRPCFFHTEAIIVKNLCTLATISKLLAESMPRDAKIYFSERGFLNHVFNKKKYYALLENVFLGSFFQLCLVFIVKYIIR